MPSLLLIQTSLHGDQGESSRLARQYADRWRRRAPNASVWLRDLAAHPPPHLNAERFAACVKPDAQRSPAERKSAALADTLIAELTEADELAIGMPMYNFTVPSTFKAWMDHVARAGVTFRYTGAGPRGLVADKPVSIFATRGGIHAGTETDGQTALLGNFFALLGIRDVRFTYAEGLALGEASRQAALARAAAAIECLAA